MIANLTKKTEDELNTDIDTHDSNDQVLMDISSKLQKLQKLDSITADLKDMKIALDFMSQKYDELLNEFEHLKYTNISQNKEINHLKSENQKLHQSLKNTQDHINLLDQYSRRENIEIQGINCEPNENLNQVIGELAQGLKLPWNEDIVVAAHRVGTQRQKNRSDSRPPTILVRFTNRKFCELWLAKRNTGLVNKNVIKGGSEAKIYINENLSPANKELFWNARMKGKALSYKYVWAKNGAIFMRKDDGQPAKRITELQDIPGYKSTLSETTQQTQAQ